MSQHPAGVTLTRVKAGAPGGPPGTRRHGRARKSLLRLPVRAVLHDSLYLFNHLHQRETKVSFVCVCVCGGGRCEQLPGPGLRSAAAPRRGRGPRWSACPAAPAAPRRPTAPRQPFSSQGQTRGGGLISVVNRRGGGGMKGKWDSG